jgi:cytoskeletal protein CcmA (bactofilin family)
VCKNADIEGKFEGTIEVAELLSIKSKASIQGSVKVGKLSVEPGADFSASCTMNNIKNSIPNDGQQPEKRANKWLALNIPIQMGAIIFAFSYLGNG